MRRSCGAAPKLAAAYTPAFSRDGSKVCLTGSRELQGETAVWVFDADGNRVGFRNWALGDLWTVDLESEALTRYDLSVAEAPIAW